MKIFVIKNSLENQIAYRKLSGFVITNPRHEPIIFNLVDMFGKGYSCIIFFCLREYAANWLRKYKPDLLDESKDLIRMVGPVNHDMIANRVKTSFPGIKLTVFGTDKAKKIFKRLYPNG